MSFNETNAQVVKKEIDRVTYHFTQLNYLIFKDGGEERCPRNAGTGTFLGALWEYYFAGERKPRED